VNDLNDKTRPVALPGSPAKKQESRDAQKVLRVLATRLKPLNFERTKPTFYTRPRKFVVEFVHVHKYTFGPMFRVHLGVRLRCDEDTAAALNGPSFDALPNGGTPGTARRFQFTSAPEAVARCAELMGELVETAGAEWFEAMQNPELLVSADKSPLGVQLIAAFHRAQSSPELIVTSPQTRQALNVD